MKEKLDFGNVNYRSDLLCNDDTETLVWMLQL